MNESSWVLDLPVLNSSKMLNPAGFGLSVRFGKVTVARFDSRQRCGPTLFALGASGELAKSLDDAIRGICGRLHSDFMQIRLGVATYKRSEGGAGLPQGGNEFRELLEVSEKPCPDPSLCMPGPAASLVLPPCPQESERNLSTKMAGGIDSFPLPSSVAPQLPRLRMKMWLELTGPRCRERDWEVLPKMFLNSSCVPVHIKAPRLLWKCRANMSDLHLAFCGSHSPRIDSDFTTCLWRAKFNTEQRVDEKGIVVNTTLTPI